MYVLDYKKFKKFGQIQFGELSSMRAFDFEKAFKKYFSYKKKS